MLDFRILGSIELRAPDGRPVRSILSQPKRVALLAFLAAAPGGTRAREEVLELLWSEGSGDPRHALNQAIYFLRRSLGKSVILTWGEQIELVRGRLRCDLHLLQDAVRDGHAAGVMELYRGPFLESLPPTDPMFDLWREEARERISRLVVGALSDATDRAEKESAFATALRFTERIVEMAPLQEGPLRRLLLLLEAAGNRAEALARYERFTDRLRQELDVAPARETTALAERLRESLAGGEAPPPLRPPHDISHPPGHDTSVPPDPAPTSPPSGPGSPPQHPEDSAAPGPDPIPGTPAPPVSSSIPFPSGARIPPARRHRGIRLLLTFPLLLLLLLHFLIPKGDDRDPLAFEPGSRRVVILPFSYQGEPELGYLGKGVTELLGIGLAAVNDLVIVDARHAWKDRDHPPDPQEGEIWARRFQADHFITGNVLESEGRLSLVAHLGYVGEGIRRTVSRRTDDEQHLFDTVDSLVKDLLASGDLPATSTLVRNAAATTPSIPSLRLFLEGERLVAAGRFTEAGEAFDRAAADDVGFALAHLRAAIAASWEGPSHFARAREKAALARRHGDRLPPNDRFLLDAFEAFLSGDFDLAEQRARQVIAREPENLEAWFQLGEIIFHYGALRGRTVGESREAWRKVLEFTPDNRGALLHLSAVLSQEGEGEELWEIHRQLDANPSFSISTLAHLATAPHTRMEEWITGSRHASAGALRTGVGYVTRFGGDLDRAIRLAHHLVRPERTLADQLEGHLTLAYLHLGAGRPIAAEESLMHASALDTEAAQAQREALSALPPAPLRISGVECVDIMGRPDPSAESPFILDPRTVSSIESRIPGSGSTEGFWSTDPGPELADSASSLLSRIEASRLASHRADSALARGDLEEARTELERSIGIFPAWFELLRRSPLHALARERFLLSELRSAGGDDQGALRLLSSLTQNSLGEAPYIPIVRLRIAEIHHRMGRFDDARSAFHDILSEWTRAEDPLRTTVTEEVARRLARLDQDLPPPPLCLP